MLIISLVILKRLDYLESIVMALFIILAFSFIHYHRKPYKFEKLNWLEFIGYCAISLLLMALIIENASRSGDKHTGLVFNILFFATTVYFALLSFPRIFIVGHKIF